MKFDRRALISMLLSTSLLGSCSGPGWSPQTSGRPRAPLAPSPGASGDSAAARVERLHAETATDEDALRAWLDGHPEDVGASIQLAYVLAARQDAAGARALLDAASRTGHD